MNRLAMVSCKGDYIGPWTIAKGNESKVEIFGLGQAEYVSLELDTFKGIKSFEFSCSGTHAWPNLEFNRYRVCKSVGKESPLVPTTVRVLLSSPAGVQQ